MPVGRARCSPTRCARRSRRTCSAGTAVRSEWRGAGGSPPRTSRGSASTSTPTWAGDLRLADIAAVVALSPYHFSRLFSATTGRTPYQFVLLRRIERAKELLGRPGVTVRQVARRTGFADAGHLSRHFRRHVGTSPARYAAVLRGR